MWKVLVMLFIFCSPLNMMSQTFDAYMKRAQQGDGSCMSYVGTCFINGNGVNKDEKKGFK